MATNLFIPGGNLLRQVRLEAASALGAWYELELYELAEGYLIRKVSGAKNRRPDEEIWFRPDREKADLKFERIVLEKTNPLSKRQRHYEVVLPG